MIATLTEAPLKLAELFNAARTGERVEIIDDGWTYRLTAFAAPRRPTPSGTPKAGRWKGKFVVPDDFKEPLEELREYME